jgi:four helix bundle protein
MTNRRKSEIAKLEIRNRTELADSFVDADGLNVPLGDQFSQTGMSGVSFLREDATESRPAFDLSERTALFGEHIIKFALKIPRNPVNNRLINQLVGSGTSVGANYSEAEDSVSRKDFKKCIGTCRKESKETKYWLRMIAVAEPGMKAEARQLWQEAKELNLIFGSIWRKP